MTIQVTQKKTSVGGVVGAIQRIYWFSVLPAAPPAIVLPTITRAWLMARRRPAVISARNVNFIGWCGCELRGH